MDDTLAGNIFELIRLIFNWVGEGFCADSFGVSNVAMGVLIVTCIVVAGLKKGIISYIALGVAILICLSVIMTKAEVGLQEAISEFLIIAGLWTMTVANLIAIIMGKYWQIKTNLIYGAVGLGVGIV